MSKFDAEYNEAKNRVVVKIQQWVDEQKALKAAGTKISKSGVKQAERAKRSIISSTDETFGFLVEEALSKDLSGEAIKNKIRGLIERQFPKNLRLLSSDRIHHKNALELVELVSQQDPDVVLNFLQRSEKEGYFFGDSLENTLGASFTEPAHTGAFPQESAGKINYPKKYGAPGIRLVSGHPAGTNDPRFKFANKTYSSGDELFDALKPALAYSADALDRAEFADAPRIEVLETLARDQGLLEPGESVREIKPGPRLQAIQKFAEQPKNKELIEGARKGPASYPEFVVSERPNLARFQQQFPEDPISKLSLGSPELERALGLRVENGSFRLSFGLDDAVDAVKKNVLGAVTGAATAIEPEAVKAALQGDYMEAVKQTGVGAVAGAVAEQTIKRATPVVTQAASKVLPKAALSMVGGAAKFVPVLAGGYAGYEMLNAIVEGATGRNLQETGVAAEETKQQLREEGYSEYELRRRARTGYRKP